MSDKMSYLAVLIALLPAALAAQEVRSGGNGTIYMGAYNEAVYVIDEATLEVTERIPVTTGIPNLMQLSPDNRMLYVRDAAMEHIEVVDLAEGRSVDSFTLSEGNTRVRIRSMVVEPGGEYILLGARSYTKLLDPLRDRRVRDPSRRPRFARSDRHRAEFGGRAAPGRQPHVLAGRRPPLLLRPRHHRRGDRELHRGRPLGVVAAAGGGARPHEHELPAQPLRRRGHLHEPLPDDGPGAGPSDDGHRAREPGRSRMSTSTLSARASG